MNRIIPNRKTQDVDIEVKNVTDRDLIIFLRKDDNILHKCVAVRSTKQDDSKNLGYDVYTSPLHELGGYVEWHFPTIEKLIDCMNTLGYEAYKI